MYCIAVCTYRRPKMLAACLASIKDQCSSIIVVDNDPEPHELPPLPENAILVREPDRGIPQARNAALAAAIAYGYSWMAFIDDDEIAATDWLENLKLAAARHNADIIQGESIAVYPEGTPRWLVRGQLRRARNAQSRKTAITNNVLFNLDLVRQHNLTFDNRLRFIGGEDLTFFSRMNDLGAVIVFDPSPRVYDMVCQERATVRWQIRNAYRKGLCKITEAHLQGKKRIRLNGALSAGKRAIGGLATLAIAPLCLIAGRNLAAYVMLSGCRNLSRSFGSMAGLMGYTFEYYRNVSGD